VTDYQQRALVASLRHRKGENIMSNLTSKIAAGLAIATVTAPAFADDTVQQNATPAEYIAVLDALHRFTWGMDTDNGALIASAFAEDGVADFSPAATKIGITFPPLAGRAVIEQALVPFAAGLVTSHTVGNARVFVNGDKANLRALVEAQQIPVKDRSRYILLKNDYTVSLVKEGDTWRIKNMSIDNLWSQGDVKVLMGQ
jgi:SnoaL-like domain